MKQPDSQEPAARVQEPLPVLPPNVRVGANTLISGGLAFKRFHSQAPDALIIGANCTMDGVHFALGQRGKMQTGDYCYFTNTVLLCELELRIGSYVVVGWNAAQTSSGVPAAASGPRIPWSALPTPASP